MAWEAQRKIFTGANIIYAQLHQQKGCGAFHHVSTLIYSCNYWSYFIKSISQIYVAQVNTVFCCVTKAWVNNQVAAKQPRYKTNMATHSVVLPCSTLPWQSKRINCQNEVFGLSCELCLRLAGDHDLARPQWLGVHHPHVWHPPPTCWPIYLYAFKTDLCAGRGRQLSAPSWPATTWVASLI